MLLDIEALMRWTILLVRGLKEDEAGEEALPLADVSELGEARQMVAALEPREVHPTVYYH